MVYETQRNFLFLSFLVLFASDFLHCHSLLSEEFHSILKLVISALSLSEVLKVIMVILLV